MWNGGTRDTLDASAGDVLLEIPFVLDRANMHYFLPYEAFVKTGVFSIPLLRLSLLIYITMKPSTYVGQLRVI